MKLLGLIGSPRENGNTATLVNAVLEGAAENGAETKVYHLAKMDLKACSGCMSCRAEGKCVIDDDMQELYEEVRSSDALVIGSPIYMWEITTQTKAFVDRLIALTCWQPCAKPEFSPLIKLNTKLVLAYTYGNPNPNNFNQYFKYMQGLFSYLGFDVQECIWASGTINPDDIFRQPEVLENAKEIGKKL
ncbi:flavodoxin family protein [Methanosarcina sp. Mfa9]|uniref:flavodoxin family protein n=1 Tax=Methanosarcina sp. Mfa9 TaxID=3439063 RepID=UPI003F837C04